MYNSDIPTRAELPTSRQLIRSTFLAIAAAIAILITVVLPSEYGVDPTGVGRALGLTEMGAIKIQLSKEAEADRMRDRRNVAPGAPEKRSDLFGTLISTLFIGPAAAQTTGSGRSDEVKVSLKPGQGTEVKLVMRKGAKAEFAWTVEGGIANYDLHGDGSGNSISYKKGRGVPGDTGTLQAAFDGDHGWFWRNRGKKAVTVTLKVKGEYAEVKRMK